MSKAKSWSNQFHNVWLVIEQILLPLISVSESKDDKFKESVSKSSFLEN